MKRFFYKLGLYLGLYSTERPTPRANRLRGMALVIAVIAIFALIAFLT